MTTDCAGCSREVHLQVFIHTVPGDGVYADVFYICPECSHTTGRVTRLDAKEDHR